MFLMFNLNCTDSHASTLTDFVTNGCFTMLRKQTLCTVILLCSSSLYANIPIESRGLSSNDSYNNNNNNNTATAVAINVPNAQTEVVPTNLNWQLTQKAQQLENDMRVLRGKLEEQDNEINQLKNELNNRYTDLDQRLELLLQKIESDNTENTDTTSEEDNQKDITPSTDSAKS
jgi:TolA-binding protein